MQLWLYVATFFKFTVPWNPCCRSHDTPFDMLWLLWAGANPSFIAIGARDSYKTLTLAASETMDILHNACGVVHIGAIESQALKCYSYVKRNLTDFPEYLAKPPLMSRTDLVNGGHLEIIPCTINRVNSPHEPKVRFDEVELADPVSYNEAKFIAASDEKGNQASIVYTTTRKFAYGLAQQEIEAAIKTNRRVLLWCYKDVTETCPDDRSGTKPVMVYVNPKTLEWSRQPDRNKREMREFQVFNKCLDCKIMPSCRSDLKRATGIKPISDVILKFENSTPDYWLSQMDCLRPSRKGLMIHQFSQDLNARKIDWKIFMRRDGSFDTDRYTMAWGKDWGWNPDATVVGIIDKHSDRIYIIKEFHCQMKTTEQVAKVFRDWCRATPFGYPDDIQCDRSEPALVATLHAHGFGMAQAVEETQIEAGCDLINYLCRPTTGEPLLIVDIEECPTLIWEMSVGYIRATDPRTREPGDKPMDKNNHFVDALRYLVWKYMRKYLEASGEYNNTGTGDLMSLVNSGGAIEDGRMDMILQYLAETDK